MESVDRELYTSQKKSMPIHISQANESICRFNEITLMIAKEA